MLRQYHPDPTVESILNDIPRRAGGEPINERCRQLDRMLKMYTFDLETLRFIREEVSREGVKFDRAQRQRRSYLRYLSDSEASGT